MKIEDLKQAVGTWIKNHKGKTIGKVEDIKIDAKRSIPEYLILCCNKLFGSRKRYFAIPASPSLIQVNRQGKITIPIDKKVLQIVLGIPAHKCPKFDPDITDTVFELYEYEESRFPK